MIRIRSTLLMLTAALATACSGEEHGEIIGDMYLAHASGMEVNLRERPVRLVTDTTAMDTLLWRVCQRRNAELQRLRDAPAPPPPEARQRVLQRAWDEREELLRERVVRTVETDARARFAIDSVPPGRYRLWADATVDGERWTWLEPVRIRGGDSTRVNLSNANADDDPLRCAWIPGSESFLLRGL